MILHAAVGDAFLGQLTFSVDASLLQELGERLIGRPEIALGELIKNSYDADASTCRVIFREDEIEVVDDGHGMTLETFRDFWMRVGTTHKVRERRSPAGRNMTGSKGLGRLSTQYLADELELTTVFGAHSSTALTARVRWSDAVQGRDLATIQVPYDEHTISQSNFPDASPHGTRILLRRLKQKWDEEPLKRLGQSLWRLRSPFRRRSESDRSGFDVEVAAPYLADAQATFDDGLVQVFENWRARIEGKLSRGRSGSEAIITIDFKAGYGAEQAGKISERLTLPVKLGRHGTEPLVDQSEFEILIFNLAGRQSAGVHVGDLRDYLHEYGNVNLYDRGFRLPYYGTGTDAAGQDWLGIAADQARRISVSELLPDRLRIPSRYMLDLPAQGRILAPLRLVRDTSASPRKGTATILRSNLAETG